MHTPGKKKIVNLFGSILSMLFITLIILLSFSLKWMLKTWANLSIDELIYHLKAPLEGTNNEMIIDYLRECLLPTLIIAMIIACIISFLCKKGKKYWKVLIGTGVVALVFLMISIYYTGNRLNISNYILGQLDESEFIENYYVNPQEVNITFPSNKKNLIYIFLESMETTYADKNHGGAFEENVIPELTELAQKNEDFSGDDTNLNGGLVMPGTTWTMGAMFGQTSGLPLNISIGANNMDTQSRFFPGIIALGDILKEEGYSQTLMLGSTAVFGGRELYFKEHGNYDIMDYDYALNNDWIPADYSVWWGYEDQKLFEFAKNRLIELSEQNCPFNLTMLTVDTHFEDGYECELCEDKFGSNQYANVMACSNKQVQKFIEWIQRQEFYKDTVIVISGDHLTMDSDFCENIEESYERKVYTTYINSAKKAGNTQRIYTTFDAFPTTLSAMGVDIEGNRLGLGTDLFSATPTLTEMIGTKEERGELNKKSTFLDDLAEIDEESESLIERENDTYTADIEIDSYKTNTNSLTVKINNLKGEINDIAGIEVAVWKEENQSDLQWIHLSKKIDGGYYADINMKYFGLKKGTYNLHFYIIREDKDAAFLGAAKAEVFDPLVNVEESSTEQKLLYK